MIKYVSQQLGICFGPHHLFINNLSVFILLLVQWILSAIIALYHVLGNFLSLLFCLMVILFQNEHKWFAMKNEMKLSLRRAHPCHYRLEEASQFYN